MFVKEIEKETALRVILSEFERLAMDQAAWSNATFGQNRTPIGALHHLAEEVQELLKEPYDRTEYADALLLLLDSSQNAGISPLELLAAAREKQKINQQRTWGAPDKNGVQKHV